MQVARVVEHPGEQLPAPRPSGRSRTAASAAPTAAGTAEAVNMNGRDWIRRNSITSAGPAITPPHEASDLEKVAIRRSTRSSTPSSSHVPAPRAPEHAERVRLVDHQPRAVARAQLGDLRQRGDVALHREHAVDDDQDRRRRRSAAALERAARAGRAGCGGTRAAWPGRGCSRRGSRRGRRSRRSTVSPGPRIVPSAPRLAWWPVVNTSAASVPSHSASSRSSSRCRSIVPLRKREPVSPVP